MECRFVELRASTTCNDCSVGSYASSRGSSACMDCPANSNNNASVSGASQMYHSILDCKCNTGFLGLPGRNEPCLPGSCTANEYLYAGECRTCPADLPLSVAGSVDIGACKPACTRENLQRQYSEHVKDEELESGDLERSECSWEYAEFAHEYARTFGCRYLQYATYLCARSH